MTPDERRWELKKCIEKLKPGDKLTCKLDEKTIPAILISNNDLKSNKSHLITVQLKHEGRAASTQSLFYWRFAPYKYNDWFTSIWLT